MAKGNRMHKNKAMDFTKFSANFDSEEKCYKYLFKLKWPLGYHCPKCNHNEYWIISPKNESKRYQCKRCLKQTSLIVQTVFEKSKTPLVKWFKAIYYVAFDKRGISALQISNMIKVTYKTAWLMVHKIRKMMKERDDNYMLDGLIITDDACFGGPSKSGKRGRRTDKTPVLVQLSLNEDGNPNYVKMTVLENLKSKTLVEVINNNVNADAIISCDSYHSYYNLSNYGYRLINEKEMGYDSKSKQFWLNKIISNCKRFIIGTYHGLSAVHLQVYLAEFCYRFNRRNQKNILENLLKACVRSKKYAIS